MKGDEALAILSEMLADPEVTNRLARMPHPDREQTDRNYLDHVVWMLKHQGAHRAGALLKQVEKKLKGDKK